MPVSPLRPLVIAYGNRLRGDDAVGWVVADALRDDPRMDSADVVAVHQLTPDLAAEVTRASRVVFVDAQLDPALQPGVVTVDAVRRDLDAGSMTHHVEAGTILSLAEALYDASPPAIAVSVVIASLGPGADLGTAVGASVSQLVETVVGLCQDPTDA
jgi:hydrogenase maturation protease